MGFKDKVKGNEKNCNYTMVKRVNKTLKSLRIEDELLELIEESEYTFAKAVNEALREKFKK